jgi:hypothetical protein
MHARIGHHASLHLESLAAAGDDIPALLRVWGELAGRCALDQ